MVPTNVPHLYSLPKRDGGALEEIGAQGREWRLFRVSTPAKGEVAL